MSKTVSSVGYLTTLEHPGTGILGGYLIVDLLGRPLEFHCTAPTHPSRAQEILYGSTFKSYLLGEKIGKGLIESAKIKPAVMLIDQLDLGAFDSSKDITFAMLNEANNEARKESGVAPDLVFPFVANNTLTARHELEELAESIDLAEPFERIHLAIREAQRLGEDEHHDETSGDSLAESDDAIKYRTDAAA